MSWRPHPKRTTLNIEKPDPWGTSDRNGMVGDHSRMVWQFRYAGNELINTRLLVHPDEYDIPNEQFKTLILPPDPDPLMNARPEQYVIDETDWRATQADEIRETQSGVLRVTQPSATEAESEGTN